MHIVALAWMFVVLLMTLAEATSSQGSLLGALITLLLYGALPLSIVLYVMGTPARGRARRAAAAKASQAPSGDAGDGGGHPTGARIAPEREEP
jgi:hypothetical protein